MSSDNDSFHVFNYMEKYSTNCMNSLNTMPSSDHSDAQTTELCCAECKCMFGWPLILLFDILSLPFRLCHHYCECCHCKKKDNSNSN
jgi:hypothetical protein